MKAPTLADVAQRAGVSYATADRVINARGRVAPARAERVRQAIEELGYVRNVAAANLSQGRVYRFAFVIPSGTNAFFRDMRRIIAESAQTVRADRIDLTVADVPAFDAPALVALLRDLAGADLDGLALVGVDDPAVAAMIDDLRAGGLAVVTLVSDVPASGRSAYVGIDNIIAGRIAARLIGLGHGGRPGRVLPVLGSAQASDHRDRLAGFREVMGRDFPRIAILPELDGRDRSDLVEEATRATLAGDPGITAIYSMGAGNRGLARSLADLAPDRRPLIVVVHELTDGTRAALSSGLFDVVIDQTPRAEVAQALALLRRISDRLPPGPIQPVNPAIILRDCMPEPAIAERIIAETRIPEPATAGAGPTPSAFPAQNED